MLQLLTAVSPPLGAKFIKKYAYEPLETERHIRLLQFPDRPGEPYRFRTCPVDSPPAYIALSYTWGSPLDTARSHARHGRWPPRHLLRLEDAHVPVGKNLSEALSAVYAIPYRGLIWVDALCINQDEADERKEKQAQIPLMGEIYSRCAHVHAWLGPAGPDLRDVLGLHFRSLGPRLLAVGPGSPAWERLLRMNLDLDGVNEALGVRLTAREWRAYVRFYEERTWFARGWIVQEAALAPKIVVHCGAEVFGWDEFPIVGQFVLRAVRPDALAVFRGKGELGAEVRLVGTEVTELEALVAMCEVAMRDLDRPEVTEFFAEKEGWAEKSVLPYSFLYFILSEVRTKSVSAKFPHDKVYAALGIFAKIFGGEIDPLLRPDYKLAPGDVFARAAWLLIRELPDLSVLSGVEDRRLRVTPPPLPSWAPDYAAPIRAAPLSGVKRRIPINASRTSPSATPFHRSLVGRTMCLDGIYLDKVTRVEDKSAQGITQADIASATRGDDIGTVLTRVIRIFSLCLDPALAVPPGQTAVSVLRRAQTTDGAVDGSAEAGDEDFKADLAFPMATVMARDPGSGALGTCLALLRRVRAECCASLPSPQEIGEYAAAMRDNTPYSNVTVTGLRQRYLAFANVTGRLRANRQLYKTLAGHVGLGPFSVLPGDQVWMLDGAKVLFVLREAGAKGEFRLVGECHLQGFMNGEVLDRLGPAGMQRVSLL